MALPWKNDLAAKFPAPYYIHIAYTYILQVVHLSSAAILEVSPQKYSDKVPKGQCMSDIFIDYFSSDWNNMCLVIKARSFLRDCSMDVF